MDKRRSLDGGIQEHPLPIPVQMFLWRHIRPFIRAKLGKLHEASCTVTIQLIIILDIS
ncbi:hypothetical protein CAJAP_04663 [Camponotus japonicus]